MNFYGKVGYAERLLKDPLIIVNVTQTLHYVDFSVGESMFRFGPESARD
jgi:hypothetical protein